MLGEAQLLMRMASDSSLRTEAVQDAMSLSPVTVFGPLFERR